MRVPMPTKCKVAMFLVSQFESSDFDFMEIVDREEQLQAQYEHLECLEIERSCEPGRLHVKRNESVKQQAKEDKERKVRPMVRSKTKIVNDKSPSKQPAKLGLLPTPDLAPANDLPFVLKKFQQKSYLGEACNIAIKEQIHKIIDVEKEQIIYTKQKTAEMEGKIVNLEGDVLAYQEQSEVFENNLDSLLKINEMYQDTIKQLEGVVKGKESIIADHLHTISKLTQGSAQELKDIKMMFFSK